MDATEPQAVPPAVTTAQPAEGFFGRAVEHIEHALPRVEHAAAGEIPRLALAIHGHAAAVFTVAGDVLPLLAAIDPGNAAAIATAEALLPKLLAMIDGAAGLLEATHRPPAG